MAFGAVFGVLVGWFGAGWAATRLGSPIPLDREVWNLIVPGHDEGLADSGIASGTGVVDGMLLIALRSFGRADMLIPRDPRSVARIDVGFGRGTGSLVVNIRAAEGAIARPIELAGNGFRVRPVETWTPYPSAGDVSIAVHDGAAWVDGVQACVAQPGTVEFSPGTASARVRRLYLEAADGGVILDQTFVAPPVGTAGRVKSAALAGLVGIALGLIVLSTPRRVAGVATAVAAIFPAILSLSVHYPAWRAACQRLFLLHTAAGDLRSAAFYVCLIPVFSVAAVSSGWLVLPRRVRVELPFAALVAVAVCAALCASRDLLGWNLIWVLPGAAFAATPVWMARTAGNSALAVTTRDLPALLAIAVGTWSFGLIPALVWRFICIVVDAPTLATRAPRAGADALFITIFAVPFACEAALRATYLGQSWTQSALEGASLGSAPSDTAPFSAYWSSKCGKGPTVRTVYTFGGSSTGGAYQFRGEPEAFFPAKLLFALCARAPEGVTIALRNFGDSGRDSFDFAQRAAEAYKFGPPSATIVYLGVNDLLTIDAPITRKERAARLAARGTAASGLDAISSSSRFITGFSLLLRAPTQTAPLVAAVPLKDAEENLRTIIALTTAAGGQVVLVTEFAQAMVASKLQGYWAMEQRLSRELAGVAFLDLYAAFAGVPAETLLADRNHLTREGGERVANLLAPIVTPAIMPSSTAEIPP